MGARVRIGAVSYLNARPLVFGFAQGLGADRVELSYDVPSALAGRMAAGELDVALLPVIELARIPGLEVVPGLAITSRGPARSVVLVARKPIQQVERVALDPESRTSNALARILLAEIPGRSRSFEVGPLGLDEALLDHDAAVRIGDKALFEASPPGTVALDLGEGWFARTGLPFAFAVWAARPGMVDERLYRLFHDSRREGTKHLGAIAHDYAWRGRRSPELSGAYLRENIRYRLGTDELTAIRRFLGDALRMGLVERAPEPRLATWRRTACHDLATGPAV